jgi:hypothetical protein
MKIRTKAPNVALTKELNENMNESTKFWFQYLAGLYFIVVHYCISELLLLVDKFHKVL